MDRRVEQTPIVVNESERIKILVVDDQPAKLLSYEVVLAEIGATLVKASSACEAFECLLKHDIALILVDVCMPDIDGFELATLIREHPRFQRIAIIFVSAVMKTDLHQLRGYDLGAVDFIPVPVAPELLRAKVKVFMDLYCKTRQLGRLNADLERQVLDRTADLQRSNEELERRIEERTREREATLAQIFEAQQMDTVGQVAGVVHDFNNLLMAVLGSLTLLKKRLPENSECLALLQNATRGAQRGAALTRGLLSFSRRRELKPQSVDVGEIVGGMEKLLKHALGFDIELSYGFPRGLAPAFMDANQLELALLNLALNARDAMPGGGRLTIVASERTRGGGAADSPLPQGDYVCLKILATGAKVAVVESGAIGLSVVRAIAARCGGLLCAGNTPSAGANFDLWLPRANDHLLGRNVSIPRHSPSLNAQ
jgi:signal transduction histidine kinase